MRITKQSLTNRWLLSSVSAVLVFGVLAWSDFRLKSLSGFGTQDLQGFATAQDYRRAFLVWPSLYAVRAGFNWGLDYLLMPLYATAFFYSGILTREAFAPRPGRLRRMLTLLAAVPIAGAVLDAIENALQFGMMLSRPDRRIGAYRFHGLQRQMGGDLCRPGLRRGCPAGPPAGAPAAPTEAGTKRSLTRKRLCV
jgi:hypothetical protein